jgi:hypothetical protein
VISYPLAVKLALEELAKLIRLRVSSDSMASLIERGDVVLVRHVNLEDLRRGDLILLEQGGSFLIHRLVAANGHGIQIEGDSGSFSFPSLSATMITPPTATFPSPGSSPCLPLSVSGFLLSLIVLAVAGALFVFSWQGRG